MGRGQEVTVTNDGATILKSLYVDNPAAKVLVGTGQTVYHKTPKPSRTNSKINIHQQAYTVFSNFIQLLSALTALMYMNMQTYQGSRTMRLVMAQLQWLYWQGSF